MIVLLKEKDTLEKRLRSYINLSNLIIGMGFISFIAPKKINLEKHVGTEDFIEILFLIPTKNLWIGIGQAISENIYVTALLALTIIWFLKYSYAVRTEMEIISKLFPHSKKPYGWGNLKERLVIPILSAGLTISFIFLISTVDHIEAYCLIVIILNLFDMIGNSTIQKNLYTHFMDEHFFP